LVVLRHAAAPKASRKAPLGHILGQVKQQSQALDTAPKINASRPVYLAQEHQ